MCLPRSIRVVQAVDKFLRRFLAAKGHANGAGLRQYLVDLPALRGPCKQPGLRQGVVENVRPPVTSRDQETDELGPDAVAGVAAVCTGCTAVV